MLVDFKPLDNRYRCTVYNMMLIYESHVSELWSEMRFEVCNPCSVFLMLLNIK